MRSEDVKKFGIIVFESLDEGEDKKTGYQLVSSTLQYKKYENDFLYLGYYDINDKEEFLSTLLRVVNEAIDNNYLYFFHFEIHGYNEGLILKNGEQINWSELLPIFQLLNIHYRNYLGIHLAVCEGASLIKYINPMERSPFGYIVGSTEKIYERDILIGFENFYDNFFFTFDLEKSLEVYNNIVKNEQSHLYLITSKYCIDTLCDIDRTTADKPRLLNTLNKWYENNIPGFNNLNEENKVNVLEKDLYSMFEQCKLNKDFYLMVDLKESETPNPEQ